MLTDAILHFRDCTEYLKGIETRRTPNARRKVGRKYKIHPHQFHWDIVQPAFEKSDACAEF